MVRARILGTGSYLPQRILSNLELEQTLDTTAEWIQSRTGIRERRIAGEEEATSDLAARAAILALDNAGLTAQDIDFIIVATITPDMAFPSTGCLVQHAIGATQAAAMDLEAACSGFLYGLTIAKAFVETGTYHRVMVIGAEIMSRIMNWEDRTSCVLFGDGAGAAIIGKSDAGDSRGILSTTLGADGSGGLCLRQPAGGSRKPPSPLTLASREHYLVMEGGDVYKFAVRAMGNASKEAIAKADLALEDIDVFVPHQANINIIEAASRKLKVPLDQVVINLDKYGNTSSASIPIALDEALRNQRIKDGDRVVLTGFGAGLTWGSAVIQF